MCTFARANFISGLAHAANATHLLAVRLEAFAVDDGWACLIILLLANPHLLEGGQGCQDGAPNPDRVLTLRGSNNLDLHGAGSQGSDFLLHAISNTWVHGGTSR